MSATKTIRVGQTVQSIYDATHTFVIDKSVVPERIFHEKDSDRWWTKNELQHLGAPENPTTSFRLNGKGKMRGTHSDASTDNPGNLLSVVAPRSVPQKIACLECGLSFQPKREWQKFHSEARRRTNWKRSNQAIKAKIQSSKAAIG